MKNIGFRVALLICTPTLLSWRPTASPRRITRRDAGHPERGDVPGWVMITFVTDV
jgi:hypothetical protein